MKFLIVCSALFVALAVAEIDEIRDKHTDRHQQSVNVARDELHRKLSKIEGKAGDFGTYTGNSQIHLGNSYASSGVENLSSAGSAGTVCKFCTTSDDAQSAYNSRQSSQYRNSDYSGVGTVYNSNARSDHDDDDVQSFVTPANVNSRFSSSARRNQQQHHEESDLSSVSSSAYRKAQVSEFNEDDLQRTVSSNDAGSGRYRYPANNASTRLQSQSQRQSESSGTSATFDDGSVQATHRVTAVVRPGQNVQIQYVPGQGVVSSSRIDSAASGSDTSSHYVQSSYPNTQSYRVYYRPVYSQHPSSASSSFHASTLNSESDRTSSTANRINGVSVVQKPEKLTNYDSFQESSSRATHTRVQAADEYDTQQRVTPAPVYQPTNGGSSRYSSQSSQQQTQQNSSSRYGSSRPAASSSSSSRVADSDYQASSHQGTAYYPAPSSASQTRPNGESSQGHVQQQRQPTHSVTFSPYLPTPSRTHQSLSADNRDSSSSFSHNRNQQNFGQNFNTRFSSNTGTDDLRDFMSEAQRLAHLQQNQISTGTSSSSSNRYDNGADLNHRVYKTAADLDNASANFVNTRNSASSFDAAAADRNVAAGSNGGYQKYKSWSRQSQWASGSEYGPDGKPKTYSSLSTGESEKYNINGEEAGYKAATSTVEKDGKVSTYSMHE